MVTPGHAESWRAEVDHTDSERHLPLLVHFGSRRGLRETVPGKRGLLVVGGRSAVSVCADAGGGRVVEAVRFSLLLHDIGTGDGIEQADAKAGEIRTPALWGLRFRRPLLHDGSAATIDDAIRQHSGEAESVIDRFRQLPLEQQTELIAFLRSL